MERGLGDSDHRYAELLVRVRGDGSKQETKGVIEGAKEKLTPGGSDSKKERSRS